MKAKLVLILAVCLGHNLHLQADIKGIIYSFFPVDQQALFATTVQAKKDQVEHLKEELETINKELKESKELDQQRLNAVNQRIIELEKKLDQVKKSEDVEVKNVKFYNELISRITDQRRLLTNIRLTRKQIPGLLEERIVLLQSYIKDPKLSSIALVRHALYSIQIFIETARRALKTNDDVKQLTKKQKNANLEIEKSKRKLEESQKTYNEKQLEQQEFKTKTHEVLEENRFDIRQQGQLIDADTITSLYKKELAQVRMHVAQVKKGLIDSQLFLAQEQKRVLKNNLIVVKDGLRVDESDIANAQKQLEKVKRVATHQQNILFAKINPLTNELEKVRKSFEQQIKEKDISPSIIRELTEWTYIAKSVDEYLLYTQTAVKQERIFFIKSSIDVYNAEIEREKAKVRQHDIHVALLHTWFSLKRRVFKETEELAKEIKKYKVLESEIERDIVGYKEKRASITNIINIYNKNLNVIRELRKNIGKQRLALFKDHSKEYKTYLVYLDEAEKLLKNIIAKNTAYIDVYTQLTTIATNTLQDLRIIIAELETKGIWQRSKYAISWEGIRNIIPDIRYFLADTYYIGATFFAELTWQRVYSTVYLFVSTPQDIIIFLIRCLVLLAFFFLLQAWLPRLERLLLQIKPDYKLLYIVTRLFAGIVQFVHDYIVGVYIWSILFMVFTQGIVPSLFLRIIFYLGSIPYLMYLIWHFICHFISFNAEQKYVIFPESFERRFTFVFSMLGYISVILLLFRQAFMIATIHKSEFQTILLAIYSILVIVFLLFSIGKEEIIALLPKRGRFWVWLAEQIDKFYYLMLGLITFIMIVSDPYVGGYKNLANYALWGLFYTILLFWLLSLLHRYLKQGSQVLFFYTDNETLKERFSYARTWYGLFAIASFFALVLIGIYVGFTIWNFPISIEQIYEWFNFGLLPIGYDRETNQLIYVTPFKVFAIVAIIVGGFLLSSIINRYVLGRIFTLLPVNLGIQNTVMSITRFLVVMLAILIGFLWANLGTLLIAIGLVIGSIGYIVREPISDFVSYFIILVQRPIQIGDYVEFTEEYTGVVRRITPRAVILRKKNSYTIVIPNSMFVTQPVSNWNYARNYIACDDIFFTVPYKKTDPEFVKKLLGEVLDENLNVLKSPAPVIRLNLFADHGFVFLVRGFLTEKNILNKWDIASDIRFSVAKKLRENGINFAFPTRYIIDERKYFGKEKKTQQ